MIDDAHDAGDDAIAKMEKHLNEIYSRASSEMSKAWKDYMMDANNQLVPFQKAYDDALKSGNAKAIKKAGKELAAKKREITLMDRHYKETSQMLATQLAHVNETAVDYVNGQLPKIYALNYNFAGQQIQDVATSYSFAMVDANTVKNLITTNVSLLPLKKLDIAKDAAWNVKKMNAEVLQGILQGESMDKIAKRFQNVTSMNRSSAIRNARTSVTSAENKGRQDCFERAAANGIELKKVWIATKDERTRAWHSDLDGAEVWQDEAFSNSYGDILYPGDPAAHPANVYNCRCTLRAKVTGAKSKTGNASQFNFNRQNKPKFLNDIQNQGIEYNQVSKLQGKLTTNEIVAKIAGGDMTRGSCASVALAYCGQKNGYNVLDYRDGSSRKWFASKANKLEMFKGLGANIITEESAATPLTNAKRILNKLAIGNEYYLSVGQHAAIVKAIGNGNYQYLELQTVNRNGWRDFASDVSYTFKNRFGCKASSAYYSKAYAIEISQLQGDNFAEILGYINTAESNEIKGVLGSAK